MFNKPLQQKYGRQRKLNYWYTRIPSVFSLAKKFNLLLKHWNCGQVTGRSCVEHSVGDNHVVCIFANFSLNLRCSSPALIPKLNPIKYKVVRNKVSGLSLPKILLFHRSFSVKTEITSAFFRL